MITNNVSFKANPIQKKGAEVAKQITENLPGFHDYVGARTVFNTKVAKAAEEANELAKKANLAEDTIEFVNHRAATETVTEEVDEFTRLNKMYADAQDKPTIINGKEVKVGEKIDIQG